MGRWNVGIKIETLEETAQALEEIEDGIIACSDFTGSLTYYCVKRDLVEDSLKWSYSDENINSDKYSFGWREGQLARLSKDIRIGMGDGTVDVQLTASRSVSENV